MMKMILKIIKKTYDNLLLKHFQLRKNMKETKDELDKTKDESDKTKDDTSKKSYDSNDFNKDGFIKILIINIILMVLM